MNPFANIFGGNNTSPAPAQQQAAPATPGNIPDQPLPVTSQTNGTSPNGTVPVAAAEPQVPDSPLDQYKGLWENKPIDPNAPPSNLVPKNLDPAQLTAAMAKADFSSVMTPQLMEAITAGGEGAAKAMMDAMNGVARQSMTQSTLINEKLMNQRMEAAIASMEARMPDMLRQHNSAAHAQDANPLFSNPAIKPIIDATRAQLLQQFPNDTPAQTTAKLDNYLQVMGQTFNPAPAPVADPNEQDWSKYL